MNVLQEAVRRVVADLEALWRKGALVGGLAVSARTEPRFTRDADFAVVVDNVVRRKRMNRYDDIHRKLRRR